MAYVVNPKNKLCVHKENGIIRIRLNGVDLDGVKDCSIVHSVDGTVQVIIAIEVKNYTTDFEASLEETKG